MNFFQKGDKARAVFYGTTFLQQQQNRWMGIRGGRTGKLLIQGSFFFFLPTSSNVSNRNPRTRCRV